MSGQGLQERVEALLGEALEKRPDLFSISLKIGQDQAIRITLDGDSGVSLKDCMEISRAVEHEPRLCVFQQGVDDLVLEGGLFQQAAFIHRAIDNVLEAVRDGSILVVLVLVTLLVVLSGTAVAPFIYTLF